MKITLHKGDLPSSFDPGSVLAMDTETMGLKIRRDRLCLVQLSTDAGKSCHLVQIDLKSQDPAPHLCSILSSRDCLKIFHYARFDMAALYYHLGVMPGPIYCTKIASKLIRTYSDRHGLGDLCRILLGIEISKQQQSSDWGAKILSEEQKKYAASDVAHLHKLRETLDILLLREQRYDLAQSCFDFLPFRVRLDLLEFDQVDIFSH